MLSVAVCLLAIYVMWLIPLERSSGEGIINLPSAWGFLVLSTLVLFPLATAFIVFRLAPIYKWVHGVISLILVLLIMVVYIQVSDHLVIRQYEAVSQTLSGGAPRIIGFSDELKDEDPDGIFEALVIEVEMELPAAGKLYDIRADLVNQEGRVIQQQKASVSVIRPTESEDAKIRRTITLSFDGKTISQHGGDGPYTLQNLYILSEVAGQVLHKQIAHTTRAYKANQFKSY